MSVGFYFVYMNLRRMDHKIAQLSLMSDGIIRNTGTGGAGSTALPPPTCITGNNEIDFDNLATTNACVLDQREMFHPPPALTRSTPSSTVPSAMMGGGSSFFESILQNVLGSVSGGAMEIFATTHEEDDEGEDDNHDKEAEPSAPTVSIIMTSIIEEEETEDSGRVEEIEIMDDSPSDRLEEEEEVEVEDKDEIAAETAEQVVITIEGDDDVVEGARTSLEELNDMTVTELRSMLRVRGLITTGKKSELIERLSV